jgi:nucleoside-diphosphate-sugar epimerase
MSANILVTGGSGKAGRWAIQDLVEHGNRVTNVDLVPSDRVHTFRVDLTDLGQVVGMVAGQDAILHLAAIPWAGEHAPEVVFRNNVMATFNILQAASLLGVKKVVLAGSESALGFPFLFTPFSPQYLPMDEDHPLLAQDAYGLSKIVLEDLGQGFARRDPSMSITCLRLSFIQTPDTYLPELRAAWSDSALNSFNLWAYVDARDVASACRLALEHTTPGFEAFYIAAADTLMRQPTLDLVRSVYPGVGRVADGFTGRMSPLDCRRAAAVLGWTPQYTWEQVLTPDQREELARSLTHQ